MEGRKLFTYSYRVPVERSRYYIRMGGGPQNIFGYEGTILVDPETAELVRLTARAVGMERETPYCEVATTLDYTRVRIGEAEFLLPREARQRFVSVSRFLTENIVTFSECREFRADSTLSFGAAPDPQPAGDTPPAAPQFDVPGGLPFTLELTTRIDSATAAAGDPFAGKLTTPIRDGRKEFVPAGAIVRGRIAKVATVQRPGLVLIVLRPETIEIGGKTFLFQATGKSAARSVQQEKSLASRGQSSTIVVRPGMTTTGALTVRPGQPIGAVHSCYRGISGLWSSGRRRVLEAGFKTEWVTGVP